MVGARTPGGDARPIAILAGSGELPRLLAERLASQGLAPRILAFQGFCERSLAARADAVIGLLEFGKMTAFLDAWQPAAVTLAGGLNRPSPAALVSALAAFRDREEIARVAARGDDNLLRGAIDLIRSQGHELIGVREIAPDLLAQPGVHGAHRPAAADELAIRTGFGLLDAISAFDVGQAAVVAGERVIAMEGPEGTDRMLARARAIGRPGLFKRRLRGGILVKAPKRGQDLRVDLPAIGPRTVVNAARAGLSGIAVASGYTLVIDRRGTVAAADRLGLFLLGVERSGDLPDPADV